MGVVPADEQNILDGLNSIRTKLTALKKEDQGPLRQQDVLSIYQATLKQITKLNAVRDAADVARPSTSTSEMPEPDSNNRVDACLGDVFQLLSLFFLRIGRSRDVPATYCQLAVMKALLDSINESGSWTQEQMLPFESRLAELKGIIQKGKDEPPALTRLLMRKWEYCNRMLQNLLKSLSTLSQELVPIHQKLIGLKRRLFALAAQPKPPREAVKALQEELREIDARRVDGKFLGGGSSVPEGQAILSGILEECFEMAQDLEAREEEIAAPLKPIYDRLTEIKGALERLLLTHRWTLRETDLYNFQVSLHEIDRLRTDGKWLDPETGKAPDGQGLLQYLLRRSYSLIYRLIASSEPISEELQPIANKLATVKRCLREVYKTGEPLGPRDFYPYQLALAQIEGLRKDGKFLGSDGSIPEGQAILNAHLSEAHEIIQTMRDEMERQQEESLSD